MLRVTLPARSRQSTIGWIGLGAMGSSMAINLFTKSYRAHQQSTKGGEAPRYLICEADDHRAAAFHGQLLKQGGSELAARVIRAHDGREMAKYASTILTMLPSTPQVEAVYLDPSSGILAGLLELAADPLSDQSGLQAGAEAGAESISSSTTLSPPFPTSPSDPPMDSNTTISPISTTDLPDPPAPHSTATAQTLLIDHTTLDPTAAVRIANQIHSATNGRAVMLDAPVSGGTVAAANGSLTIMLGSPSARATAVARPLLETMAREGGVVDCGSNGTGVGVKASGRRCTLRSLILAINQIALAEGLALGRSLGIDPLLLHNVINSSSGQSWSSRVNSPLAEVGGNPGSREFRGGFQTRLMLKDVGLALSAAHAHDLPTPLTWAAKSVYDAVCNDGGGDLATKDFSVVFEWLKQKQSEGVEKGWKEGSPIK